MSLISAKVLKDSISIKGNRLITLQIKAPKFLDAQFEKHRMLSSNSSSDRAKPLEKLLSEEPFIPDVVYLNKAGMQGTEKLHNPSYFKKGLQNLYQGVAVFCKQWGGVHKQTINRYLLPFNYQDKVVTANYNQYQAFFDLRLHDAAQPEIYELALHMKNAIDKSTPQKLKPNQWHIPYVDDAEHLPLEEALKCSVARCARVSYSNHDGSSANVEKDLELYNTLLDMKHLSCFEHQACPMEQDVSAKIPSIFEKGVTHIDIKGSLWSANFQGWIQYRKLLD